MLILTRRLGERIVIGEDVVVEVVRLTGNTVRLGITTPDGVTVWREELLADKR